MTALFHEATAARSVPAGSETTRPALAGLVLGAVPRLEPDVVAAWRPRADALSQRISLRIQSEVAAFGHPSMHALIQQAITASVDLFVDALAGAPVRGHAVAGIFRWIGRAEAEADHDLDAVRAAHHIATHESWTELRSAGADLGLAPETIGQLADALLGYQEHLLQHAIHGFAQALPHRPSQTAVARARLLGALLRGDDPAQVGVLAEAAGWTAPDSIAVISTASSRLGGRTAVHHTATLVGTHGHRVVVIAPAAMAETVARDLATEAEAPVAVSWGVAADEVHHAGRWSARLLRLASHGLVPTPEHGVLRCADHRAELCLHADPILRRCTDLEVLAPLVNETPKRRAVLAETMLLWLQTRESAPAIAARLEVHEQTVRHRLRRLRKLFGPRLSDPTQTVDLLTALESATPRWRHEHD
jgi:hypothetical protein